MKRFKFENVWIREKDCSRIIKESWEQAGSCNIIDKMEYCSLKLEEWGGGKAQEMQREIQQYRNDMRKLRARKDDYGVTKYNEARNAFLKLLERQKIYWKQRAKQFWLREGDQNTKFFHRFVTGRKRQNKVTKLQDSSGNRKEDKEGIRQIITDYFSELFQSSGTCEILTEREKMRQVTAKQNHNLNRTVTSEEVKLAVFAMHPDKSPGVDGLNPGFFQAYWSIIGEDVVKFCQHFVSTGELPAGVNRTVVCLVPKVKQPQRMM